MNIEKALGVAARIWCDFDYETVTMNPKLAEQIAVLLMDEANKQAEEKAVLCDGGEPGA